MVPVPSVYAWDTGTVAAPCGPSTIANPVWDPACSTITFARSVALGWSCPALMPPPNDTCVHPAGFASNPENVFACVYTWHPKPIPEGADVLTSTPVIMMGWAPTTTSK